MTSKSSSTTNVPSNIQFLILKWHTNDSNCDFTLFYSWISRSMAFYLIDGNKYWRCFLIQILTWYFERSVVPVIKISPELNADFECPHPKLEICQARSQQFFATQKCWRLILCFCMFIVSRLFFYWRNLTLYVSFCREESRRLSEMFYCKIPSQSKES